MTGNRKVVWAEGILLTQQHFQHWDLFLQRQNRYLQNQALAFPWGIALLELDDSYLPQGLIRVNRCTALLKDGRWIDFDHHYDGVLSQEIPTDATGDLTVSLALPIQESVAGISGYVNPNVPVAWCGDYQTVSDLHDSERVREVLFAKQDIKLMIGKSSLPGYSLLQVAVLEYHPKQASYRVNQTFFPSMLKACASPGFLAWISSFTSELARQLRLLSEQKEKHRQVHHPFGQEDFIYFNLMKDLTEYWTRFSALQSTAEMHPYEIYDVCCGLLGALLGYLSDPLDEPPMPQYHHDRLGEIFSTIRMRFDTLMKQILPVDTLEITLHKINDVHYESVTLESVVLDQHEFYLMLYHETLTQALVDKILAQVKIAAPSKLMQIIHTFTQGIELTYLPFPARDLLARRHYHCFKLNKQSNGWLEVVTEGRLALFTGQELSAHSFELISHAML